MSPSRTPSPSPSATASPSRTPSAPPTPSSSPSHAASGSPAASSSPGSSASASPLPTLIATVSASPTPHAARKGSGDQTVIIGSIVGVLAGVGLLAGLTFLLITNRKKKQKESRDPVHLESDGSSSAVVMNERPKSEATSNATSPYSDFPKDSQIGLAVAPTSPPSSAKPTLSNEVYISDVKLKGLLGKGKFGEVYEGIWCGTTSVACKKLKKDDKEEFENEIMLLMKLNHPNIVRCLGIWSNPSNGEIFMILELLRLGSLTNFLRNPESQKKLAIADLIEMSVHTASGMVFLEQKNIVHRDLGARNLLVTESDGRYVVKISDFGLSRQVEENDAVYSSKEGVFPVKWSPPEVINFRKFTSKSDVWSFGITMWEIFELGKVPYPTLTNDEAVAKVMKGYRLPIPETCPEEVYKLMLLCWSANPDERPNFKSIHERLLQILKSIRGEDDEDMKYTTEDADKNYAYNNNKQDTYNNHPAQPHDTYQTGQETYNNSSRHDNYNS